MHSLDLPTRAAVAVLCTSIGCSPPKDMRDANIPEPAAVVATSAQADPEPTPLEAEPRCYATPVSLNSDYLKVGPVDLAWSDELERCLSSPEPIPCAYAIGKKYFDAHHFELAGPIFERIALDPNAGPAGPYAAEYALECLNVLATRAAPPRPVCIDELQSIVPRLQGRFCAPEQPVSEEVICPLLDMVAVSSTRYSADQLFARTREHPGPDSAASYRRAAGLYRALFDEYCRLDASGRNARGAEPRSELKCDEVIYNTYVIFSAAGDTAQAEAAKAELFDPRNGLTDSEVAKELVGK